MDRGMRAYQQKEGSRQPQTMGQGVPRPSAPLMNPQSQRGYVGANGTNYVPISNPQIQQPINTKPPPLQVKQPAPFTGDQASMDVMNIKKMLQKDNKGKYVCHARITEDSSSASSRPPSNSSPSNKKPRVIILCVKESGRMQLHKAKEFKPGVFQIGRTWEFEELTKMEFDDLVPTGFSLEMGKLYYWETDSPKERRKFCGSLLQNYIQYTGGKTPSLVNCSVESLHLENTMARYSGDGKGSPPVSVPSTAASSTKQRQPSVESAARKESLSKLTRGSSGSTNPVPKKQSLPPASAPVSHSTKNIGVLPSPIKSSTTSPIKPIHSQNHKPDKFEREHSVSSVNSGHSRTVKSLLSNENYPSSSDNHLNETRNKLGQSSAAPTVPSTSLNISQAQMKSETLKTPEISAVANEKDNLRPLSASSIEFVGHKKTLSEVDDITSQQSREDEYEDVFEDYTEISSPKLAPAIVETPVEVPVTSPLQIKKSSTNTPISYENVSFDHVINSSKVSTNDGSFNLSKELDNLNISFESMKANGEFSFDRGDDTMLEESSIDLNERDSTSHLQPKMSKVGDNPIALTVPERKENKVRARTYSRAHEEENSTSITDLFDEIEYDYTDNAATIEKKLLKELNRLESQKLTALTDSNYIKSSLASSIDTAISECDTIKSALSFFAVELAPLATVVNHIEQQGQNLQIQTINKKLLRLELRDILSSVSISDDKLAYLARNRIKSDSENINNTEKILAELYSALIKMRGTADDGGEDDVEDEMGNMRALSERKVQYERTASEFFRNFKNEIMKSISSIVLSINSKLNTFQNDTPRLLKEISEKFETLLQFGGLMLFVKEISLDDYNDILEKYEREVTEVYTNLAGTLISKAEQELSKVSTSSFTFTSAPRDIFSNRYVIAKKNNPKKKVVQSNLLESLGLSSFPTEEEQKPQAASVESFKAISICLTDLLSSFFKSLIDQQNVFVRFFHMSSKYSQSFQDFVAIPVQTRIADFKEATLDNYDTMEADIQIGDNIFSSMSKIFQSGALTIGKFATSTVKTDYFQIPAVCAFLEEYHEKLTTSNYSYLDASTNKTQSQLLKIWTNFIDSQIQTISSYTPSTQTRVFPSIKALPEFARRIQSGLSETSYENTKIYSNVCDDVNRLWYEVEVSLKKISHPYDLQRTETLSLSTTHSRTSKEDDLSMDDHLTLLLNYTWLTEEFRDIDIIPYEVKKKMTECQSTELNAYCNALAKSKSLGKLIDFVEGVEGLTKADPAVGAVRDVAPSKRNAYKPSLLKSLLNEIDIGVNIRDDCKDLREQIFQSTYIEGDASESLTSITVAKDLETDLYNSAVTVLSAIYSSIITSRLTSIVDKYYSGVDIPFDRRVINYHFSKESLDSK